MRLKKNPQDSSAQDWRKEADIFKKNRFSPEQKTVTDRPRGRTFEGSGGYR